MAKVKALFKNKAFLGALAALLIAGGACLSQGVSGLPALLSAAQAVFVDAAQVITAPSLPAPGASGANGAAP